MVSFLFIGFAYGQEQKNDILVILGHPKLKESKANKTMIEAIKHIEGVKIMDIYSEDFSVDNYKKPVEEASILVFQFPFYWASAPSEIKRWIDEMFVSKLGVKGKSLLIATTTGSEYEAYRSGGRNGYTMDELLRPYQLLAKVAQMKWLTPFILYSAGDEDSIIKGSSEYKRVIEGLLQTKI